MIISNSEASSYLRCQRQHYYAYREALKPKEGHSKALTRGIVGHEALEAYYLAKKDGRTQDICASQATRTLMEAEEKYPEYAADIRQLHAVLSRYISHYWDEPWKILEVETSYSMPLDLARAEYGLRLDLLVEVTSGREKGQIHVIDHKFVYNFFNDQETAMNSQLIKYIHTLRHNGIPARKGVLNQIRYRELKSPKPENLFRRSSVVTTEHETKTVMEEFSKIAGDIRYLREEPLDRHKTDSTMTIDKMTCGSCAFQPLCKLYLQGQNESRTMRMLYTHNDYVDQYRSDIAEEST